MDAATRGRIVDAAHATSIAYPAGATIHRALRRAGGRTARRARRGRARLRDARAVAPTASRMRCAAAGGGTRASRRRGPCPCRGHRRRLARRAEGGCGLRSDRPRASRRAHRVHPGRRARSRVLVADDVVASRFARPGLATLCPDSLGARLAALPADATDRRRRAGRCRVRDLHVRVDRHAEGRGGAAPRGAAPRLRHRLRRARSGRRRRADGESRVRRLDVRVLGAARERRAHRADREDDRDRAARARRGVGRGARHDAVPDDRAVQRGRARGRRPRSRAARPCCSAARRSSRAGCARCCAPARRRASLHVYGPTETTTFATWHEVLDVPPDAPTVPIGRPIANTEAFVLRERRRARRARRAGRARRSAARASRSATSAAPSSPPSASSCARFAPLPARRLYRTGDRVRLRDDRRDRVPRPRATAR